jgi:hypothetical protein
MIRLATISAVLAGAAFAAAPAHAEDPPSNRAPIPGRVTSAAAIPAPRVDLSDMLVSLNEIRRQAGVGALAWSNTLATQANKTAAAAAAGECTYSSTRKAIGAATSIFYWTPAVRRIDGKALAQDILPSFVVSEWRRGGDDYNPATGVCRRPGVCNTYSRIATPLSKSVGCARVICPSQAQVWVCRFDDN